MGGRRVAVAAGALCSCAVACTLDWSMPSSGAAHDGGAPADGHVVTSAESGVGPNDAPPSDGGVPCTSNAACPLGTFCHFPDHLCGHGAAGICVPKPNVNCANAGGDPVCACSGSAVDNECTANAADDDVSAMGNCGDQFGTYSCGYVYCYLAVGPPDLCEERVAATGEVRYSCANAVVLGCPGPGCNSCNPAGCSNCRPLDAGGWILDCK